MAHIDQVEEILEDLTSYSIVAGAIESTSTGIWIQPSQIYNTFSFNETEYFDIVVIEDNLTALELKKTALLKIKTTLDFDYNDYDAKGYISVADGSVFDLDDNVVGSTSAATGTVYKIETNTLYIKNITGTWETAETITDGGTATSTTTSIITPLEFPYYLTNKLIQYEYDLDHNASVGGTFVLWIRYEARWVF